MIKTNSVLDAKGLACPMPIVRTKKAMNGLEAGEVLEVQATDKGSTADMKAWAESTGHQYLGTLKKVPFLNIIFGKLVVKRMKKKSMKMSFQMKNFYKK